MRNTSYITTEKHPFMKEGIIISKRGEKGEYGYIEKNFFFVVDNIHVQFKKKWIKHIEPETYTRDELVDFAVWVIESKIDLRLPDNIIFNKWLESKES